MDPQPSHRCASDGHMFLNSVQGIGPILLNRLFGRFEDDPWKILSSTPSELSNVKGVGKQLAQTIQNAHAHDWLKKEKKKLHQMGGQFLVKEQLPGFLNQLPDPPIGLYSLGEIPTGTFVSIVGTRGPSLYGKKFARQLAFELAQAGVCIVSGMARGIDTEAHLGALDAGGKTIAFLGSGLDVIYPPENLRLYQRIQEFGSVLSEFPLGKRADRRTFPMRNRLVAGCSTAVIVIESAKSGGSMITAKFAAEQGRTVFALPGRVDQPESQGCLDLIRDGAILVRNSTDVLEEILPMMELTKTTSKEASNASNSSPLGLDSEEREIINLLKGGERMTLDEIQSSLRVPTSNISPTITMLEIKGLITKRPDGKFETNI